MIRSHVQDYSLYCIHSRTPFLELFIRGSGAWPRPSSSDCVFDKETIKVIFKFN